MTVGLIAVESYGEAKALADALGLRVQPVDDAAYSLYANDDATQVLITPGYDKAFTEVSGGPIGRPGKMSAAVATTVLLERFHPDVIINAGTAAGVAGQGVTVGDVVVASAVASHDIHIPLLGYEAYGVRAIPLAARAALEHVTLPYKQGVVSSGESFVLSDEQWHMVTQNKVMVQEMEAAGVLQAVDILGYTKPVYVVKSITTLVGSNGVGEEAAQYEQNAAMALAALARFIRELVVAL